jgi:hypothetical protein
MITESLFRVARFVDTYLKARHSYGGHRAIFAFVLEPRIHASAP